MEIELSDVPVASLVPAALSRGTVEDFMNGLRDDDGGIGAKLQEAAEAGEVLRYVGVVDVERGPHVQRRVGVQQHDRPRLRLRLRLHRRLRLRRRARQRARRNC